jgi:pilus assembly protein Flp/PilA
MDFPYEADEVEMMPAILKRIARLLRDESGPTAVEYAVMLALIVVICLASIRTIGTNAKTAFTNVGSSLGGS